MTDEKISPHVTLLELTKSDTALRLNIPNIPNDEQITALKLVCSNVYEKAREHFGKPIYISSGFRSKDLNIQVGGQLNSQHLKGEAIDMDCDVYGGITNKQLFDWIKENLNFDQLIFEGKGGKWVHVSWVIKGNRNQVLNIPNP